MREAKVLQIVEGTNQIQRLVIGRHLTAADAVRAGHGAARTVGAVEDIDRPDRRACSRADGRMSYTDLGKATGLSISAVHQRVRRLEQRGVITGLRRGGRRRGARICR